MECAQMVFCARTEVMVCVEAEESDCLGRWKEEAAHGPVAQHASVHDSCGGAGTPVEESRAKEEGMWAMQAGLKM
jgi:hypothetical protein